MNTLFKIIIVGLLLGLSFILVTGVISTPPTLPVITVPQRIVDSTVLSSQVNDFRVENGLNSLPEEASLCKYAEERAEQIKTQWNHDQFWNDQCLRTNYGYCGENLSKGYSTEEETLEAWKNSPTHLENLTKNWSSMCIKCSDGHCAQEFGI